MASDLRDRLEDLAAHTPHGVPPVDLWDRGVRRRRALRAATAAVVAAVVLLVGVAGWATRSGEQRAEPADTHGTPHLPDRFYEPSPWLHSFDGPPGQLVATGTAEHQSLFHIRTDVYGVTASGGEYGFLDLPQLAFRSDHAGSQPPVLSPDGRFLAYWTTGPTPGSPNTALVGQTVAGVAVFDAVTGAVRTARLATKHGIMPLAMAWSDARTLVLSAGQIQGGDDSRLRSGSYSDGALLAWRLEDARPSPLTVPRGADGTTEDLSVGRGFVVATNTMASRGWLIWPRTPARDRRVRLPAEQVIPVISPTVTRVATVAGDRNPNRLVVSGLPVGGSSVRGTPVGDSRQYYRPLLWTDDHHVAAVVRNPDRGAEPLTARLDLVDVDTGSARTLVDHLQGGGTAWDQLSFASSLLTAPSAHASPPPRPWDLRGVAIGVLIATACLALAFWGIRGRRA